MILRESAKPADDGASNRLRKIAQLGKPRKLLASITKPDVQALAAARITPATPKPEATP